MIKTIQQRLRNHLIETQTQNPGWLPSWLRDLIRAISGGDTWTASFLRRIMWKYRWLITISVLANVGAGLAEAATLGVFTLALNLMAVSMQLLRSALEFAGRRDLISA